MRRYPAIVLCALLAGLLSALIPQVSQCQQAAVTVEDLTRRADVIVVGKVTAIRSEWSADHTRISSRVTLSVDQNVKGDGSASFVTISTPGGEVDGVGEMYSHMARFKADEEVVVFAARDRQGQLRVVDGDQGKMTVTREGGSGSAFVGDNEPLMVFTSRVKAIVQAQNRKE